MDYNFIPYNGASESVKLLQNYMTTYCYDQATQTPHSVKRYRPDSPYVRRLQQNGFRSTNKKTVLIRWGNAPIPYDAFPASYPNVIGLNMTDLNPYIDKLKFFQRFRGAVWLPKAIFSPAEAQAYVNDCGSLNEVSLVERNLLSAHSGAGIRLLRLGDTVTPSAKLWVKYIKKEREFRVHFVRRGDGDFNCTTAEKLLRKSASESPVANRYQIRNHDNGWVFATQLTTPVPQAVKNAVATFMDNPNNTLDFGAIDLIYNVRAKQAFILEVNTAPGITGRTVNWYANEFQNIGQYHDWDSHSSKFKPTLHAAGLDLIFASDDEEEAEPYTEEDDLEL